MTAIEPGHALYDGTVWHHRVEPAHRFTQRVTMAWLDLAMLDSLPAPWLSASHLAPAQVRRRDLHGDPTIRAEDAVRATVAAALGTRPDGRVHVLANLRTWGFCFNPLTVYWCTDGDGRPVAELLEVTNTPWHERHAYVIDRRSDGGERAEHQFAKALHVSPFLPMDCTYRLDDAAPTDVLRMRLAVQREGSTIFEAGLRADRRALDAAAVRRLVLRRPTQRVSLGIHTHAARLWRKGATFHRHPAKTPTEKRTSEESTSEP